MNCPRCGAENAVDATICTACNHSLAEPATGSKDVTVRIHRGSIVSISFGLVTVLGLILLLALGLRRNPGPIVSAFLLFSWSVAPLLAIIFGVASLIGIACSGGKAAGRGFAAIGITLPITTYILLFLVILPRFPRSRAYRMVCGSNLSGIGKAMLIYANDFDDELPHAGGPGGRWASRTPNWMGTDHSDAFDTSPDGSGGEATVSASLYLLVKYSEAPPKSFICRRGEPKAKPFTLRKYRVPRKIELIDLWDFGPNPPLHVSYAYHMPYSKYRLTASADPGMPIAADRNPWMTSPFSKARDFGKFTPDLRPFNGTRDQARRGNCLAHKGDGQNVLYLDSHVAFEKYAYCGVDDDNIYTRWDADDRIRGLPPVFGSEPADEQDSLLVNDPPGP